MINLYIVHRNGNIEVESYPIKYIDGTFEKFYTNKVKQKKLKFLAKKNFNFLKSGNKIAIELFKQVGNSDDHNMKPNLIILDLLINLFYNKLYHEKTT